MSEKKDSNLQEQLLQNTPENVKSMVATTFVKSFNSMPNILRWGTIIAIIVGVFYFTIAQKYITRYKETTQIEVIQSNVTTLSEKVKILEEEHQDAIEIYENLEEVRDMLAAFENLARRRSKNLIRFIKKTHRGQEHDKEIIEFEETDLDIDKEYRNKINEILDSKIRKRMEERKIQLRSQNDEDG